MSPRLYMAWTPASDTQEMPTYRRGVPVTEQPTEPLHLLDLPPAPTPARRGFLHRADVVAAWNSALTVVGGIAAGLLVLVLIHATKPLGELLLAVSHGGH